MILNQQLNHLNIANLNRDGSHGVGGTGTIQLWEKEGNLIYILLPPPNVRLRVKISSVRLSLVISPQSISGQHALGADLTSVMEDSTSPQCRILVVSSSLQNVFHLIHRTCYNHRKWASVEPPCPICFSGVKADTSAPIPDQKDPNSERSIPWTIRNKYYTADVHFQAHEIRYWSSTLADGVPAIIFVWSDGEVCSFSTFMTGRLGRAAYTRKRLSRSKSMFNIFQRKSQVMIRKFLLLCDCRGRHRQQPMMMKMKKA